MGIITGTNYVSQYSGDEIDAALASATNAGQVNGVLEGAGDGTFSPRGVDSDPTVESTNLVESGGVYGALSAQASATATALAGKVDKEAGKGLSENDYTDEEKAKLAGIEAGAQVNTVTGVKGGSESSYRTGNVNITKANIGLGNVDNTSDLDKPLSTATAAALANKQDVLTFDNVPTENSANPVKSGGVYDGLEELKTMILASFPTASLPSAPIHAFGDGADNIPVKAMAIDVRAVQDLHGYDKPWPSGGGANKLPNTATSGTVDNVQYTVNADGTIKANGTSNGWTGLTVGTCTLPAGTWYLRSGVNTDYAKYYLEATGGGHSYATNASPSKQIVLTEATELTVKLYVPSGQNVSNLVCYPMIAETGVTEYVPNANICPIVGWDEAQIVGTGKNLFDGVIEAGTINSSTGENADQANRYRSKNYVPIKPGYTYQFSKNGVAQAANFVGYKADKTFVPNAISAVNGLFTVPNDVYYIRFFADDSIDVSTGLQLELGSSATTYAPYNGHLVTIDFGGTVYGGTLEYVGGKEWEFTPTHIKQTVTTVKDKSAGALGQNSRFSFDLTADSDGAIAEQMCDRMGLVQWAVSANSVYAASGSLGYILIGETTDSMTIGEANTWLANNPVDIMYRLATPLDPITLTADGEVVTEYGDNVLYADCGDSELTYRQDIGLVIGE